MAPENSRPFQQSKLIVLRCPACGSFVAAGFDPKLLQLALRMHICAESQAFAVRNQNFPK